MILTATLPTALWATTPSPMLPGSIGDGVVAQRAVGNVAVSIIAGAAVQCVVAAVADEGVIEDVALERIVAVATEEEIDGHVGSNHELEVGIDRLLSRARQ